MTFTLTPEPDGMWKAEADPCAFHFVSPDKSAHTRSEGMYYRHSDRAQAVYGLMLMFSQRMIEPLSVVGFTPETEMRCDVCKRPFSEHGPGGEHPQEYFDAIEAERRKHESPRLTGTVIRQDPGAKPPAGGAE